MAASRYLKNPRLMGYEKDEEMWAAAVIMSQLSGLEMELHLEDGHGRICMSPVIW